MDRTAAVAAEMMHDFVIVLVSRLVFAARPLALRSKLTTGHSQKEFHKISKSFFRL